MSDVDEITIFAFGSLLGAGVICVSQHSSCLAFPHIDRRVTYGIVSIPECSALTLRLLADDVDAVDCDDAAGITIEDVFFATTAESQSPVIFLWAGVIFDQWFSEVDRWPNSIVNLYWPLPDSERITSSL